MDISKANKQALDEPLTAARRTLPTESALILRLSDWVSLSSGSNDTTGLTAMGDLLAAAFAELGHPVERPLVHTAAGETRALSIRCRSDAPVRVLLNGHYDTVYAEPSSKPRIEGDRFYGQGAADMKGGLLVLLETLRIFETLPESKKLGWEVLITTDEEIGSEASVPLLKAAAERNHYGLTYESSLPDGALVRNRMATGTFHFTCQGKAAHVGRDFSAGRNAILGMANLASKLDALNQRFPSGIYNVGAIKGGGVLNIVPDHCSLDANFRARDAATVEESLKALEALIREQNQAHADLNFTWEGSFSRPPKQVDIPTEALFTRICEAGTAIGQNIIWRDTGGASDGNFLSAFGLPNIDTLGVRGNHIHSPDEYAVISSISERILLSVLTLVSIAHQPSADPHSS